MLMMQMSNNFIDTQNSINYPEVFSTEHFWDIHAEAEIFHSHYFRLFIYRPRSP